MRRLRRGVNAFSVSLILFLLLIFALGPVVVLVFNSVKSTAEIGRNPLGPPQTVLLENFASAWEIGNFSLTTVNSGILVVGTVACVLVLGGAAAYSVARLAAPGAGMVIVYFLVVSTLPIQLFLVPLFFLWKTAGLLNTHLGVIIIYTALNAPLAVLLLRSYLVQLPPDFEDAARVDGANEWQTLWRIVIPLSWPGFLTVGLVVALAVWNEFLIASLFMNSEQQRTVVTSYFAFTSRFTRDWGLTSAAALIMVIPVVLIFLALQRRFIEGLTQGGRNA